jgi:hypothetical protein
LDNEIMQMKISLDWIKPEIWRRFLVSSSISLEDLHTTIQTVMGWTNSHLYGFYINGAQYSPDDDGEFESEGEPIKGVTLKKLKLSVKDEIRYIYDFGDNWEHTIKIEKILPLDDKTQTPLCIDGERNCPPEDCGAAPGYEDLIEALKKPKSKEAKEITEWLGRPYNPEDFNIEEINDLLKPRVKTLKIMKSEVSSKTGKNKKSK